MPDDSTATPTLSGGFTTLTCPVATTGAERLVAGVRSIFGGGFEVAASGTVVLGSAFSGQTTTCFDGQLLTSAD